MTYMTCWRSCLRVIRLTSELSEPSSLQTMAILSSGLLGWELGCKQQSAILRTEPGSHVPPCFDGSEDVSKMQFGG